MELGHPFPQLMLLYNNVARLRQFLGTIFNKSNENRLAAPPRRPANYPLNAETGLAAAGPIDLNLQIADFLP